jgi:hypothetical protein
VQIHTNYMVLGTTREGTIHRVAPNSRCVVRLDCLDKLEKQITSSEF